MENAFSYHLAVSRLTNDVTDDYRTLHCQLQIRIYVTSRPTCTAALGISARLLFGQETWPICFSQSIFVAH